MADDQPTRRRKEELPPKRLLGEAIDAAKASGTALAREWLVRIEENDGRREALESFAAALTTRYPGERRDLDWHPDDEAFVCRESQGAAMQVVVKSKSGAAAIVGCLTTEDRGPAAAIARVVCEKSVFGGMRFLAAGAAPALVDAVRSGMEDDSRRDAALALAATAAESAQARDQADDAGGGSVLALAACSGGGLGRACVRALFFVPYEPPDVACCLRFLLRIVDVDPEDKEARRSAAVAVRALSTKTFGRRAIVNEGGPAILLRRLARYEAFIGDVVCTAAANLALEPKAVDIVHVLATNDVEITIDIQRVDDETPKRVPAHLSSEFDGLVASPIIRTQILAFGAVGPLAARARHFGLRRAERQRATAQLAACASKPRNAPAMALAGGIGALADVCEFAAEDATRAAEGLVALAFFGVESQKSLVVGGALTPIVQQANRPTSDKAASTCADALRAFYEGGRDTVEMLVDLMRPSSKGKDLDSVAYEKDLKTKAEAALGLGVISANEPGDRTANANLVVDCGAVPGLVAALTLPLDHDKGALAVERAAEVLANVALHVDKNRTAILDAEDGVKNLVGVIASRAASDAARAHATFALTNIALRDDIAVKQILAADAIPPIVHLAKWGSRKAQEKANVALNILGIDSVDDLDGYHDSDDDGDHSIRNTIARNKSTSRTFPSTTTTTTTTATTTS